MNADNEDNDDPQLLSPTFSRRKLGEDGKKIRHRKRVRSAKHHKEQEETSGQGSKPTAASSPTENTRNKLEGEEEGDSTKEKPKEEIKPPPPPPPIHSWKKPRQRKLVKRLVCNNSSKGAGGEIVSPVVLNNHQRPFHYRGSKNRRPSQGAVKQHHVQKKSQAQKAGSVKKCFEYGNYNRYYGYRNRDGGPDHRLQFFNPEWFAGRDVLDIGCNVGHLTLAVARTFGTRSCLGVDIDDSLIRMAKTNVKHYTSCIMPEQTPSNYGGNTPQSRLTPSGATPARVTPVPPKTADDDLFPMSLPLLYGPIDPTNPSMMPGSVRLSDHASRDMGSGGPSSTQTGPFPQPFPQNVKFACCNYVLENDDLLDAIQPEYDTIMCLSTTKWIHLNFGDDGIKRAFKRMYAQLRPGGKLILEAQGFQSYKKRKNLTERIKENFNNIQLRPEGFRDYLIHEVNFSVGETIAIPQHSSQGFQRPIQVFTKLPPFSSRSASSCHTTPYYAGSSHNTPYYFPPSPLGMFPPRPGRPCYAPMALTPMYNSGWNEESGYDQPDSSTNPAYSPSGSAVNPSSTPGYSPSGGAGNVTPSATPTGSGPPSTSNSPFGGHGSP